MTTAPRRLAPAHLLSLSLLGTLLTVTLGALLRPDLLPAPLGQAAVQATTPLGVGGSQRGPALTLTTTGGVFKLVISDTGALCAAVPGATLTLPRGYTHRPGLYDQVSTQTQERGPTERVTVTQVHMSGLVARRAAVLRREGPCTSPLHLIRTPWTSALL